MIKLLIADDHPVVRQGLTRVLTSAGDLIVAGEAADGAELAQLARSEPHDMVLLDLSMPHTDVLDLLKQLKRERPAVPVLILTIYGESQFAVRALKAGAGGYLLKECSPEELITAIRKVKSGGRYLSTAVAEALADHLASDADNPPHHRLSDREFQVLRLIAGGTSTRAISEELSLSVKTVSTYWARIFEKMQMKTR
jgi:two-component system, NarL family, invasion response regulator UvrY